MEPDDEAHRLGPIAAFVGQMDITRESYGSEAATVSFTLMRFRLSRPRSSLIKVLWKLRASSGDNRSGKSVESLRGKEDMYVGHHLFAFPEALGECGDL